jgi:putative toxin-antitoxin system antitoxin component (TIGR02293 family)
MANVSNTKTKKRLGGTFKNGKTFDQDEIHLLATYTAINNRTTLVTAALKGVPSKIFMDIVHISGQKKEIVAQWFDINAKTITNYVRAKKTLNPSQGEKSLKYINLFKKGVEVFGGLESFNAWLQIPSYGLGKRTPISLMGTSTGIDLIEEELIRIAYGDLA